MSSVNTVPFPFPQYSTIDNDTKFYIAGGKTLKEVRDSKQPLVVYNSPTTALLRTSVNQQYTIQPTGFNPTAISALQQVQFRIPKGFIASGVYESVFLQMQFTETTGLNSAKLAIAPYILSAQGPPAVSIGFNGNGAADWMTYADAIYSTFQSCTTEQMTNLAAFNQLNMSLTDWKTSTAIPAGGQAWYNLPIIGCALIGCNAETLAGDTIININFNNGAQIAGTGVAQLSSIRLVVTCHKNNHIDKSRVALINEADAFVKNTPNWQQYQYGPLPITAGQLNQIPLSNLTNGLASSFLVMLRSNKSGAGLYNFSSLSNTGSPFNTQIDVVNASNQSVLGNPISEAFSRATSQFLESPGTMSTIQPLLWVYFSGRPGQFASSADGSAGVLPIGPNMTLNLTPSPQFVSGNYFVDILVLTLKKSVQADGQVKIINPQ